MSLRSIKVDKSIDLTINLKVTLHEFTTHEGRINLEEAIEEFMSTIKDEITSNILKDYVCGDFLESSDYVTYHIEEKK